MDQEGDQPVIPENILGSVTAPFVSDRTTYNNLKASSRTLRQIMTTSHEQQPQQNSSVASSTSAPPPWSEKDVYTISSEAHCIAVSKDGRTMACGTESGSISVWDVVKGPCHTLQGHSQAVRGLDFSPCGKYLASASYDNSIRLWTIADGSCYKTLNGHSWGVWDVKFLPSPPSPAASDDKEDAPAPDLQLASCSSDQTIRQWNVTSGESTILHRSEHVIQTIDLSPLCAGVLAFGSQTESVGLRLADGSTKSMGGHSDYINQVSFSPNGLLLVSASDDDHAILWFLSEDGSRCTRKVVLEGHERAVNAVAFLPDSSLVATGSDDETIKFWDCRTGDPIGEVDDLGYSPSCLAFSPNGHFLFTSGSGTEGVTVLHREKWNLEGLE